MLQKMMESYVVEQPEQAMVLLNPLRAELLGKLVEPTSAAEVARSMGETAQRINYHLKALEKVGLIRRVGTRQVRNLVEVLYQSIAKTFILAESLGWKDEMVQRLKDQGSLSHLVTMSERMKRDALLLLERSDGNEEIPSATLQTSVALASQEERHAFVTEYVALVQQLVQKYNASGSGEQLFQVVLAVYPQIEPGGDQK